MADEKRETALALYKGAEEEERRDANKFSHDQNENKRETEDGIKSVARAYYERASVIQKKEVNEYLSSFDCNRDTKISLVGFKTHFNDKAAAENVFKVLDSNKDGLLDFDDFLVLFYFNKRVIRLIVCDYCGERLAGRPHFSCVPCLSQSPKTYDLCCHCYGRGDFHHHHPSTDFLHDQGLVTKFKGQPKTQLKGEKEMEELQNIAMLHYNATPPEAKVKVKQFFYSMDRDADGKVNERDFLSFMREQRLDHLLLCRTCYQSNDCDHASDHGGATTFLENYTLLETIKQFPLHSNQQAEASSPGAIVPVRSGANPQLSLLFFLLLMSFSIVPLNGLNATAAKADIGVILDLDTSLGKICKTCISMAIEDFYSNRDYTTTIVPHFRDSSSDVIAAASAGSL